MRSLAFFFAAMLADGAAQATNEVSAVGLMLLQPERIIEARVSVAQLAPYLKQVDEAAVGAIKSAGTVPPSGGFVVVAIRPGGQSKIWLDFTPALPTRLAEKLLAVTQAIPVPAVRGGTVVIAMKYSIGGAPAPTQALPSPAEWAGAGRAAGQALEIGDLVDRIWK